MRSDLPSQSPTVLFRAMDDGGVLFCSRTEVYFGVNHIGAAIWKHLPASADVVEGGVEALLDDLQRAHPDVARSVLAIDVREFLGALEESELATYADSAKSLP